MHPEPPRTLGDAKAMIDSALATTSHDLRTNVSQVTGYSPGALAFHRDMLLDTSLIIDLLQIRNKRQISVDKNLRRVNAKQSSYDYQPRQKNRKRNTNTQNLVKIGMGHLKLTKCM